MKICRHSNRKPFYSDVCQEHHFLLSMLGIVSELRYLKLSENRNKKSQVTVDFTSHHVCLDDFTVTKRFLSQAAACGRQISQIAYGNPCQGLQGNFLPLIQDYRHHSDQSNKYGAKTAINYNALILSWYLDKHAPFLSTDLILTYLAPDRISAIALIFFK